MHAEDRVMGTAVAAVGHALTLTGSMTWEILWALILGFAPVGRGAGGGASLDGYCPDGR